MSKLSELTPSQGVELALTILLENGWKPSKYYSDWKQYAGEEYDEEDEYPIVARSGAWEAMINYTEKSASDGELTAKYVANEADGEAHDSETYFVVLSLTDSEGNTRFFKRDGWYMSYDGGHLEEGEDTEVFPRQISLTVYKESK